MNFSFKETSRESDYIQHHSNLKHKEENRDTENLTISYIT